MIRKYSIYVYQDPKTLIPFYIGYDSKFGYRGNYWRSPHAGHYVDKKLQELELFNLEPIIIRLLEFDECENAKQFLKNAEIYWIAEFRKLWGFEIRNVLNGDFFERASGWHHTKEACLKMSESHKGKHHSELHCKRLSLSNTGKHHGIITEEARRNLSLSLKGRHFSEEHKYKLSKSCNKPEIKERARRKKLAYWQHRKELIAELEALPERY